MKKIILLSLMLSMCLNCLSAAMFKKNKSKIEAELISFSKSTEHYFKKTDLVQQSDVLMSKIMSLPTGENETALYFAFDEALDRVDDVVKGQKDPDTKYYVVLLTDGLDNVSIQMAKNKRKGNYKSDTEYASKLNRRINSVLNTDYFFGLIEKENIYNTFQSWPIMFYGEDISDPEYGYSIDEVTEKLRPLCGAQNTYTPEPIVDSSLEGIIETFKKNFIITSYSFYIPKGYINKRIRMEFEDKTGNITSLEADFIREKKFLQKERYILENITTQGGLTLDFTADNNAIVSEEVKKGENSALFTISNLKVDNDYPYSVSSADQLFSDGGKWRRNSEFETSAGRKENAYIMFVLDTSKSLGSEATNVKKTACRIIETIRDEVLGQ